MKNSWLLFLAATGVAVAADVPSDLKFETTKVGTPLLRLLPPPNSPRPSVPTAPNDLLGSAASRERIIRDFWTAEAKASYARKKTPLVPLAPTDLIGPSSDRVKLIEHFHRSQAVPPRTVTPRAKE